MTERRSDGSNLSLVLAACIVVAGLIAAAVIVSTGRQGAVPSEDAVRQQVISQMQAQVGGKRVKMNG